MSPRIDVLAARRDEIAARLEELDNAVIARSTDLEGDEATEYAALEVELPAVIAEHGKLVGRANVIADSVDVNVRTGVSPKPVTIPAQANRGDQPEAVYHRGGGYNPFADLYAMKEGDSEAAARVMTHNRANAERFRLEAGVHGRATTTGTLSGLVVPNYLIDDYATSARPGRPFADAIGSRPLTHFSTVIGVTSAGTSAANTSAEGGSYVQTDFGTSPLAVQAYTVGGYSELSVEAVEFGAFSGESLFTDLDAAYARQVDYYLFHGASANNQVPGIYSTSAGMVLTSATSATSGAAELWAKVIETESGIAESIFEDPTVIVMSPKRWYRILSELDSDKRPIFGVRDSSPVNVQGVFDTGKSFAHLPVITDANIYLASSADTRVIVCKQSELRLLEQNGGRPTHIVVDQAKASQGLVQFIARGFIGFTALRRPKATGIIYGLPVPTFL